MFSYFICLTSLLLVPYWISVYEFRTLGATLYRWISFDFDGKENRNGFLTFNKIRSLSVFVHWTIIRAYQQVQVEKLRRSITFDPTYGLTLDSKPHTSNCGTGCWLSSKLDSLQINELGKNSNDCQRPWWCPEALTYEPNSRSAAVSDTVDLQNYLNIFHINIKKRLQNKGLKEWNFFE